MSWGESISAEMGSQARSLPSLSDGKAFSKIGSRTSQDGSDTLIKKRTVILDMGEASREQGFRLNGCR